MSDTTASSSSSPCVEETILPLIETPFGNAIVLSIDDFIQTTLPPLPSGITDMNTFMDVAKQVTAPRHQILAQEGKILCGYSANKPSKIAQHKAFRPLQDCAKKIAWQHKHLKQTTWFVENTKRQWDLHSRSPDALPDAFLYTHPRPRASSSSPVDWLDIVVSGVYHQQDSEKRKEENATKVTCCMSECMARDPRRRFTFGFTVENELMRLWYCDRGKILASGAFSFIKEPIYWFRFLLGCLFSEESALGFDPTMKPLPQDDGNIKYDITVRLATGQEHIYRTMSTLSDSSNHHLTGRGTRVWKAVEIYNGAEVGEPVALKDSWVDDHRQREGSIYASVRDSAHTVEERSAVDGLLLTVLGHGDVFVAGSLDQVPIVDDGRKRHPPSWEHVGTIPPPVARSLIHYRIVFRDIGESLWQATSLYAAFLMLKDASRALYVLHKLGWIHGDVNPGNILLVGDTVKVTDLEYMRKKEEMREHDRACHRLFVPLEVQWHKYLFIPYNYFIGLHPVPFRYHPLHDLESLWWICIYFFVAKDVVDPNEEERSVRIQDQRDLASRLDRGLQDRERTLRKTGYISSQFGCLHPSTHGSLAALNKMRFTLLEAFYSAEKDLTAIPIDVGDGVYNEITSQLDLITQNVVLQQFCIRDLP